MVETILKNKNSLSIFSLKVSQAELTAHISDGRTISIPISWFNRLSNASLEQLQKFQLSPGGYGIHWPELDEDISINSFINP